MPSDTPADFQKPDVWRIADWIVFAILTVAMALLIPRHEPWFDETQAWLLARDAPWWQIVWNYARHEGSPSLWHTLLLLPAKGGFPHLTLNIISGALALAGAALLIFRSPMPRALRLLLPCGFFLFYQYGIVARSYALLMPLLWLAAIIHPRRFERPWRYVGVLLVMSHASLHAAWISGALMAVFAGEAWWRRRVPRKQWCGLVLAFAADTAFIVAQLWTPADVYSPPQHAMGSLTWPMWQEMTFDALSPWPMFSALVLICLLLFFFHRGVLLSYALTTGGLLGLFAGRHFSIWHQGLLFALLVLHLWLAWASPVRRRLGSAPDYVWPAMATGFMGVTAAVHVWWAAVAGWHDWEFPYSGSRAAAAYLRAQGIDRQRVHVFKFSTYALLFYLDHNPFANVAPFTPGSFWVWTREVFATQTPDALLQGQPPWILVGAQMRPAFDPIPPPVPGYGIVGIFPGRMIWKDEFYRTETYFLYRRAAIDGSTGEAAK